MIYTKLKLIIIFVVLLLLILLIKFLYNHYVNNTNTIDTLETFNNAIDLLNKYKSIDVSVINDDSSLETSIYQWSTLLQNMQEDSNKIKAIGLYKPNVVINGITYSKLGDMLSLNSDFSPPLKDDFTLLLNRSSSDIKTPIDYNLIVSFGNNNLPTYYRELQDKIDNTNLAAIKTSLNNCINYNYYLQSIINNNKNNITSNIVDIITSQMDFMINTQSIKLLNILDNNQDTMKYPIDNNTVIVLPLGLDISIKSADTYYDIMWNNNINLNKILLHKNNIAFLPNNNFKNVPDTSKLNYKTFENINIFQFIQSEIITYLQNICNDIINIYNNTTNTKLLVYLNLTTNMSDVKVILQVLNNIQQDTQFNLEIDNANNETDEDTNINTYTNNKTYTDTIRANKNIDTNFNNTELYIQLNQFKNTNTFLGNIITLILDNNKTYYYNYVKFKPSELIFFDYSKTNPEITLTASSSVVIKNDSLLDNINSIFKNMSYNINNLNANRTIFLKIKPHLYNLSQFQNSIADNTLDFFPLQIYEPVAPPGYVNLGHIFCNTKDDLNKIKSSNNVACIPIHCAKDVRDWVASDKVFEYNKNNVYWALYKNPYIGTFIAVNKSQLPPGKVRKVIACVAKCTAIEELTKADNCARKYQQINKSIMDTVMQPQDLVGNTEDQIYLNKIKSQSDNIARLKNRAQQMQISIDKSNIINEEMNKSKLQDYVDTQQRNIGLVVKKLENDNNTIKANINIPIEALNNIIDTINNLDTLSQIEKENIINKVVTNATKLSNNTISQSQYNNNLNQILRSCPQYDTSSLVKKDLVADVCYGCGTPD